MKNLLLTFCDKKVEQCYTGGVSTEHVVPTRLYTLYRHTHTTPNLVGASQLGIPTTKLKKCTKIKHFVVFFSTLLHKILKS